jgi:membrane fusion protein (multidrug efflux system)
MSNTAKSTILALSALALLAACDGKQQGGPPPGGAVEVGAVTLEPGRIGLSVDLPGRTVAFKVAEVRPQVGGIVKSRMFQEGAEVKAGQQLYQIDPATYAAQVESANADLAKARANLKSIEAKAARYADLVQINAVSRQDYDDVKASLDQAKAQIMVAQAQVATARINLDYTKVYAPISGRIGKSSVTEGALVTAGQAQALATITQLDPIYVDVSQSSSDLLKLKQALAAGQIKAEADGAPVTLTVDGAGKPYDQPGRLQFSEVTVDQSTGAVLLRAQFPNPRQELYPGLFVRARVEQGALDQALLVPQRAVVRTPDGGAMLWVIGADNKVAPRPVQLGQALGDKVVVAQGAAAGDKVVVEGLQKIRPGAEVRIAAPAPAPGAQPAKP